MNDLKWIGAKQHNIKVIFDDGDFYYTKINGTKEIVFNYYIGNKFAFIEGKKEKLKTCTSIIFLD